MVVIVDNASRRALLAATTDLATLVAPSTVVGVSRAAVAAVVAERRLWVRTNEHWQDRIRAGVAYTVRRRGGHGLRHGGVAIVEESAEGCIRCSWDEVRGWMAAELTSRNEGIVFHVEGGGDGVESILSKSTNILSPKRLTEDALVEDSPPDWIRVPDGTPTVVRDVI